MLGEVALEQEWLLCEGVLRQVREVQRPLWLLRRNTLPCEVQGEDDSPKGALPGIDGWGHSDMKCELCDKEGEVSKSMKSNIDADVLKRAAEILDDPH